MEQVEWEYVPSPLQYTVEVIAVAYVYGNQVTAKGVIAQEFIDKPDYLYVLKQRILNELYIEVGKYVLSAPFGTLFPSHPSAESVLKFSAGPPKPSYKDKAGVEFEGVELDESLWTGDGGLT